MGFNAAQIKIVLANTSAPDGRDETIRRIRAGLKARSGKAWSVRGGDGTAWGWIEISSPPRRCVGEYGYMSLEDRAELSNLLGGAKIIDPRGISVPASNAFYTEFTDLAEGRPPRCAGTQYWD